MAVLAIGAEESGALAKLCGNKAVVTIVKIKATTRTLLVIVRYFFFVPFVLFVPFTVFMMPLRSQSLRTNNYKPKQ
jgi:hypothetical protein